MAAALPHELLTAAQQVAHLLGLLIRHETTADQPVRQQFGQPGGIVDVGLAPGHVLDVRRVRQHQDKIAVAQDMPHRLPIDPGRLHRDVGASLAGKPVRQSEQFLGCCLEGAHLALDRTVHHVPYASHDRVLMNVKTGAMRMQNFHRPSSTPPAWDPR
jgi:hypothetical protein